MTAAPAPARGQGFEMEDLLLEGISRTLEGDPAAAMAVWQRMRQRDPSDPAAPLFEVYTLFSQQVADQHNTDYDEAIARSSEEAIRLARARVVADDADAEAHFYLGQALFHRARLRGIRGKLIRAGSDGEAAREQLERALELDPTFVDAELPLGMWYYYAGLLPDIVKWLSFLWFVPTGEQATGLRLLQEVAAHGELYRWDATSFLLNIYTVHEPDHEKALGYGASLTERFPANFLLSNEYLELLVQACRLEAALAEAARVEQVPARDAQDAGLRRLARVWGARAELLRGRPEPAWALLEDFGPGDPARPYWGSAWVLLTRAQILDAQGERRRAVEYYERVAALEPPRGSQRAEEAAVVALQTPFDPSSRGCGRAGGGPGMRSVSTP